MNVWPKQNEAPFIAYSRVQLGILLLDEFKIMNELFEQ